MAYMLPYIPLVQVHNYLCILMYTYVYLCTTEHGGSTRVDTFPVWD